MANEPNQEKSAVLMKSHPMVRAIMQGHLTGFVARLSSAQLSSMGAQNNREKTSTAVMKSTGCKTSRHSLGSPSFPLFSVQQMEVCLGGR
jgi:hypothetical protein